MKHFFAALFLFSLLTISGKVFAQTSKDTTVALEDSETDQEAKPKKKMPADLRPRRAAIRSALIPGWGQFYNGRKSYWKIPVIYGAGAAITWFLINNNKTYWESYHKFKDTGDPNERINRDNFRSYRDWNIVMLIGLYALNIVDASVTAHLRDFDIGDDLTLNINPYICPSYNNRPIAGLSMNFKLKR